MKIHALLAVLAAQAFVSTAIGQVVPPDAVVAKVDGKDVTAADIRKIFDNAPPQLLQVFHTNPQVAIQDVYVIQYLGAEAEKLKLAEQDPWKSQIENARMNILFNAMVSHERDYYMVTPDETEAYYKANVSKYQQAKIKAIYVGFKPGAPTGTSPDDVKAAALAALAAAHDPKQRAEIDAKALAAEIVKKARDGADFVKLVEQYSEDATSKAAGGDFGTVKADSSFPEDIKKAVAGLKPGEVSDPVRQANAFYVIRVEEKSAQSINEARDSIIQTIRQEHLGKYLAELRARFAPKIEKPEFFLQLNAAPAGKP